MEIKLVCQNCNQEFEAKRADAKWCPACRPIVHKVVEENYEKRHPNKCRDCGESIIRRSTRCHSCENKRRIGRYALEGNPNWKGGRSRQSDGYVYVLGKREGRKHCYQLEHTMVWEKANGRLPEGWIIHHLNGVRDDNRLENLAAMPRKHHSPRLVVEPYQQRIQQLEAELSKLQRVTK